MDCFSLGECPICLSSGTQLALVREPDQKLFAWCPQCEAAWGSLPASADDGQYSTLEIVSGGRWHAAMKWELRGVGVAFEREMDDWTLKELRMKFGGEARWLCHLIRVQLPAAVVEETAFDSGALDLKISLGDRVCVLQRSRSGEIGVSTLTANDVVEGHDEVFSSTDTAVEHVVELLTS